MFIIKNLYKKDQEEIQKINSMIEGVEKNGVYCGIINRTLNRVAMEKIRVLCKNKLESSSKNNILCLKYLVLTKEIYIK